MRSTRSRGIEIDYRILNSTGERVPRIVEDQMASKHLIQISTLADNIIDFIDENGPNETGDNVDAIDKAVGKAEVLRNEYRMQLKEAQVEFGEKFEELFGKESIIILDQLKDHIKSLKQHTISIHQSRSKIKTNPFKTTFLTDEIERISNDLEIVWTTTDLSKESDTNVKRRKKDLDSQIKDMKSLSSLLKELMMESSADTTIAERISHLNGKYKALQSLQSSYTQLINNCIINREFEKHDAFKTSLLNIKLPKFNGYQCSTDIYTFRSNFEKLYLKSTPSTLLPDLLKNNFLENPALLLVKNVTSMNDIWRRLIDSYGDQKTLLSKKLSELQSIEVSWRVKDHAKTIESLSKIVNTIRDLMQLAEYHKIERKLYYSDSINYVYKLLGENRLTRYLSSNSDETKEGREEWKQLIVFLEKEIRVNQQKLLINRDDNIQTSFKHSNIKLSSNKFQT